MFTTTGIAIRYVTGTRSWTIHSGTSTGSLHGACGLWTSAVVGDSTGMVTLFTYKNVEERL